MIQKCPIPHWLSHLYSKIQPPFSWININLHKYTEQLLPIYLYISLFPCDYTKHKKLICDWECFWEWCCNTISPSTYIYIQFKLYSSLFHHFHSPTSTLIHHYGWPSLTYHIILAISFIYLYLNWLLLKWNLFEKATQNN